MTRDDWQGTVGGITAPFRPQRMGLKAQSCKTLAAHFHSGGSLQDGALRGAGIIPSFITISESFAIGIHGQ